MDVVVGGIVALGMGVIVIAGIYQLSKGKAPLVTAGSNIATASLSSIFK